MKKILLLRRKFPISTSWALVFLCIDGAFWVLLLLPQIRHAEIVAVDDIIQFLSPLLVALLCLLCFRRQRGFVSLFLGLGILALAVGQGIWCYYELIAQQPPFPSFADLGFLASYPLLLLGIMFLPARQLSRVLRTRIVLDGLMMMTAILTFSWYFVLGPTLLQGDNSLLARMIGTAYPCCDVVLLLCVMLLWMRQGDQQMRPVLLWLSFGLIMIVVVDSLFDYLNLHDTYSTGSLIDPLWLLGYQCVGLAVFALQRKSNATSPVSGVHADSLGRLLLPYAFVPALALLFLYTWYVPGEVPLRSGVYVGTALLIGLVLLRQVVAMRELHTLYSNNDALASANKQLGIQAAHDALTGLPNRSILHRRLELAIDAARENNISSALLLLDLDRFKEVNDTLGHDVGDLLLQEIGPRLQGSLRSTDLITRLGGDEFAIVLPMTDAAGAVHVSRVLLSTLEAPFMIGNHAFGVGGSVGIALTPEHGFDVTTLLRCADVAMYVAKRGQSGNAVYTPEIDQYSQRKLTMMSELRCAIAEGGLLLHYQPKVSLSFGKIVGVEALVRWLHPEHGLIPPDEFIPLAEHSGLIGPLTRWVLEQAIRQCRDWERVGLSLNMAVNLSTRTLYDQELPSTVIDLLRKYGVAPKRLTLEITEGTLMDDPERARVALAHFRELGVSISLDDFGTGYSSLAYLKHLPLDEIKIDKTFVLGLGLDADPADVAIVRAVMAMARPLQCEVVAEGVENVETWAFLRELGCDLAQGYYLSRPLPATALAQWAQTTLWGVQRRDDVLVG